MLTPAIKALYEELTNATRQGADVQPMHFNATAYHDSKIYQVQDEMQKETQKYLEIKKQQEQARIMNAEASLPPDVRMHLLNDQINRGITQGLVDTGKDIVYGFIDMARDPLKTATNTVMALWNWKQTSALIAQAIAESYDKDMVHGNAYTRSRWVTYAFATLVTSVVGTKGVGQISKVAKLEKLGTSARKIGTLAKTNVAEHASKAADRINGWNNPFAPKVQYAGDVPYNTINSSGLRNKLSKIAGSTGKSNFINHINNVRSIIQQSSGKNISNLSGKEVEFKWLGDNYKAIEIKGNVLVNGQRMDISRRVYQINNIDWNYIPKSPSARNLSNRELTAKGRAPYIIDKNGKETQIELHHLIQKEAGNMVEIVATTHDKYKKILHGLIKNGDSFRNNDLLDKQFNNFRKKYWKWRSNNLD